MLKLPKNQLAVVLRKLVAIKIGMMGNTYPLKVTIGWEDKLNLCHDIANVNCHDRLCGSYIIFLVYCFWLTRELEELFAVLFIQPSVFAYARVFFDWINTVLQK